MYSSPVIFNCCSQKVRNILQAVRCDFYHHFWAAVVNLTSQLAESRHNQYEVWLLPPYISELWLACSARLLTCLRCDCWLKFMTTCWYNYVTRKCIHKLIIKEKSMEQYFLKKVRKTDIYSSKTQTLTHPAAKSESSLTVRWIMIQRLFWYTCICLV